jgi:hypothetical protein
MEIQILFKGLTISPFQPSGRVLALTYAISVIVIIYWYMALDLAFASYRNQLIAALYLRDDVHYSGPPIRTYFLRQ